MSNNRYQTKPYELSGMPPGIPYIVGNEAAERFSFYGMKAILSVFLTQHLLDSHGQHDVLTETEAKVWIHSFNFWTYILPAVGALLADWLWGKYRTILSLSVIYCLGHAALAINETREGITIGLALIAIGAGGIKPCVSAHVGDQFGNLNRHLLPKVFSWFYFSINIGAATSMMLTPYILNETAAEYGGALAFGIPGILMAIATVLFWVGRNTFVHIPARGKHFWKETFNESSIRSIGALIPVYFLVSFFWSLFDQTNTSWVFQAQAMDTAFFPESDIEFTVLPAQMQSANPILVMILIPLFSLFIYPAINRYFPLTPLRKLSIGFFVATASFLIVSLLQESLDAEITTHIAWQILAYLLITAAEVMISITCLEFAYTQAPPSAKSLVMSMYLATVAVGNLFTVIVNKLIQNEDGTNKLEGAAYYWFFTAVMAIASILFVFVAKSYRGRTYGAIAESDAPKG